MVLVKILSNGLRSCVINDGKRTKHFLLRRGARQSDPILVFLFTLVLEILFLFIKTKPEIIGLIIIDHCYYFPKDSISIKNMVDIFHFSRTSPD